MRIIIMQLAAALMMVLPAMTADAPPDLTKGGKKDELNEWTLGPTGARGWIWGQDLETTKARQILVTKVYPDSRSGAARRRASRIGQEIRRGKL